MKRSGFSIIRNLFVMIGCGFVIHKIQTGDMIISNNTIMAMQVLIFLFVYMILDDIKYK